MLKLISKHSPHRILSSFTGYRKILQRDSCWRGSHRPERHFSRNINMEQSGNRSKVVREEEICRGKWLALNNYHWQDHTSRQRVWEVVSRTTRQQDLAQDSVAIIATVVKDSSPECVILIKQFRPPLKTYTIEMPAGLIDNKETPQEAALRELKEETGYTGSIVGVGGTVALDPGISNSTMMIVTVKVDGNALVNQKVNNICGVDGEQTEVFLVPLPSLHSTLKEFASAGLIVDSRVEAFALGLSFSTNKIS